jgi:2-octaprenyl-6-methoxyphenol hydroxylase
MQHDYDVLIVGGGLAGNCLALSLIGSGLRTAIVEANTRRERRDSPAGDRALALSYGTVLMLDAIAVWQGVQHAATPIKKIHISDRGHFGKTRLSAEQEGVAALGYVITARDLEEQVADLVEQAGIEQICPARVVGLSSGEDAAHISLKLGDESVNYSARLVVGADGGNSSVRNLLDIALEKTEYGQTALVTTVKTTIAHNNVAYERFTESGPLAMLPVAGDLCAVVWTRTHEDAQDLVAVNEQVFIDQLQACFGYRLGALTLVAPRRAFPLTLVRAEKMFAGRAVIVGNAVHQLHPVAGQGFNLGLRDVVQLAEKLMRQQQDGKDIGAHEFLAAYADCRLQDHDRVTGFTDYLVRIFSNDWLPVALARNAGLAILDQIPVAKAYLTRYAMGMEGRMPRVGSRR